SGRRVAGAVEIPVFSIPDDIRPSGPNRRIRALEWQIASNCGLFAPLGKTADDKNREVPVPGNQRYASRFLQASQKAPWLSLAMPWASMTPTTVAMPGSQPKVATKAPPMA